MTHRQWQPALTERRVFLVWRSTPTEPRTHDPPPTTRSRPPHDRGRQSSHETGSIASLPSGESRSARPAPRPPPRTQWKLSIGRRYPHSTHELGGERLPGRPSKDFQVVTKCENPAFALASPIRPVTMAHTAAQAKVTVPPTLRARALKDPRYSPLSKSCRKAVFGFLKRKTAFDGGIRAILSSPFS